MSRSIARILSKVSNEQRLKETERPSAFEEMRRRRFDMDLPVEPLPPLRGDEYNHLATDIHVPSKARLAEVAGSQELFAEAEREMHAAATPLPLGAKRHTEPKSIYSSPGRSPNGSMPKPKMSSKPKNGGKFEKRHPYTNLDHWVGRYY